MWSTIYFLYGQLDFLCGQLHTFYMVNSTFYVVNLIEFLYSQLFYGHLYSIGKALRALKLNQTKMASACAIATQALEAIGNLQSSEIRNLAASTVTNSALNGSNLPTSSSSIAAELGRRFPTFNARGGKANRKRPSTSSMTREKKYGRPAQ